MNVLHNRSTQLSFSNQYGNNRPAHGVEIQQAVLCSVGQRMRKALKVTAFVFGIAGAFLASLATLSWSKKHLDWYTPVAGARVTVDGAADQRPKIFRSTSVFFALAPDRSIVLIPKDRSEKQTYVILAPGPGHLPEGFKGSIRRCESVFVATPLFGFANDFSECVVPGPNRDGMRHARFDTRFVEFTDDDGRRVKVQW